MKGVASAPLKALRELDDATLDLVLGLAELDTQEYFTENATAWARAERLELVALHGSPPLVVITDLGKAVVELAKRRGPKA